MEYRVHTKDGKTYSYNEPSFASDKFLIFFGITTALISLGFYFTPGDQSSAIPDAGLLGYAFFMLLGAVYEIHKLWYNNKWRNKTKIIQLTNGKYVVYQYMRYRTGCDWEFGDVFCDWGWMPYGCSEMIEEDAEIGLKRSLHFSDLDEARELKKKIDDLYRKREEEIMERKMEEDGVIPAREVK